MVWFLYCGIEQESSEVFCCFVSSSSQEKRHGISPGDISHQDHLKHRVTHFDTSQAPVVSTINRELYFYRYILERQHTYMV